MPSTHLSLHYHVIFCTKGRRRIITETWRAELHAYIGGIIRDMGGVARTIGGPGDHVHIPLGLKATHTLADAVRQVKRGSAIHCEPDRTPPQEDVRSKRNMCCCCV